MTEQTYYRWKKQYGGLRIDQAKRLKDLEKENSRLKRLLADVTLKTVAKMATNAQSEIRMTIPLAESSPDLME